MPHPENHSCLQYGVAILGGGPAGLSAALWLHRLGLDPVVIEREERLGGMQNLNFLENDWVLGLRGLTGPMLAAQYSEHVAALGVTRLTGQALRSIRQSGDGFDLTLHSSGTAPRMLSCRALVIATGTRYRAEEVLAEVQGFAGIPARRFAFGPHAFLDSEALAGQRLLVIGGGDNAFENVRILAPDLRECWLAMRSPSRAQHLLKADVHRLVSEGRCRLLCPARLVSLEEKGACLNTVLHVGESRETLAVDRIHVLAGYEPNSRFIKDIFEPALASDIPLDGQGYIRADALGRTAHPRIFAAGDICNPAAPSVASAVGQGSVVAKTIEAVLRRQD